MRSAEDRVPGVRLGSFAGIPQWTESDRMVKATAPFSGGGGGHWIYENLRLVRKGRLPLDHWMAAVCSVFTGGVLLFFRLKGATSKIQNRRLKRRN